MISADGNDVVVMALEKMLELARQGRAGYLIAVMVGQNQPLTGGWFGAQPLQMPAMTALENLRGMMEQELLNATMPEATGIPQADRVCYNVPASPISYDFINWLMNAEMSRIAERAPAPLKVGFWFGRDGKSGLGNAFRAGMFEHVVRPALALVGAVEDPTAIDGRRTTGIGFKDIVHRARAGRLVPKFRSTMLQMFPGAVTITLREAENWPHRNSNLDAWLAFADDLQRRGERVIFVRDTARATEPLPGFATCPPASTSLQARAALYQSAKMNLFISNGPASLAYFSDWPWMMFVKIEPDGHTYAPNTPRFWRDELGMEIGQQFPWSRPDQRIVWAADDYDNLIEAWELQQKAAPVGALLG